MTVFDEEVAPEGSTTDQVGSIGRKAGRGLKWSLLGNFFLKLGSFGIGLILARLLTPDDFGVYALALAVTALLMHVNDFGMIAAGVQWRGRFEEMAPTGSTIALVISLLGYGVVWILAPTFASLASTPEAAPVVRLLAVVIVVDGVTAMRVSVLQRRFEQDRLTIAIMAGWVANAALAVPLAFAGAGAYSFAGGQVFGAIVTGVVVFKAGHLPVRFAFDKAIAVKLLTFGVPLAASLGVESVLLNADYIIIGNALGSAAVGYYLLAFNISSWVPGLIGTAVRVVSIAGFSRLAEHDAEVLEEGVRRSVPLLVTAILPIAVVMTTLAAPLIDFLYGDQWGPSAAVLRLLTVLMVVRMLTSFAFDILTSLGATKATVWVNLGWAAALLPALWVGTRLGGIEGASAAHGICAILVALPLAIFALHRHGISLVPALPGLVRPTVGAVLSATVILLIEPLTGAGSFVQLLVSGGAGCCVFVLVVVPFDEIRRLPSRLRGRNSNGRGVR